MTTTQILDLGTSAGCAAYVKTFTLAQLRTLADAPTTMGNFLVQSAAQMELILRSDEYDAWPAPSGH